MPTGAGAGRAGAPAARPPLPQKVLPPGVRATGVPAPITKMTAAGPSTTATIGRSGRSARVPTPNGGHTVRQAPFSALTGPVPPMSSVERARRSTVNMLSVRAGVPAVTAVTTAMVRQRAPQPARTYGMAPVVNVRRFNPFR